MRAMKRKSTKRKKRKKRKKTKKTKKKCRSNRAASQEMSWIKNKKQRMEKTPKKTTRKPLNNMTEESEYEDSGNKKQTAEKFFRATKYKNNCHQWLVGFYQYLCQPSAGHKKKYMKLQHASQMKNILQFTDKNGNDIKCLALDEGDAAWKRFVVPSLESHCKKSGTIISYLMSYKKFLNYITNPRCNRSGPPLYQSYIDTIVAILPEIKGWWSTVDSETQAEQNDRWLAESTGLLTLKEITALKESNPTLRALEQFIKLAKEKYFIFNSAGHLLLVGFATDSGTRPSPLNNAKLSDYEKAESSDNRVMLILKHKRAKDGQQF